MMPGRKSPVPATAVLGRKVTGTDPNLKRSWIYNLITMLRDNKFQISWLMSRRP